MSTPPVVTRTLGAVTMTIQPLPVGHAGLLTYDFDVRISVDPAGLSASNVHLTDAMVDCFTQLLVDYENATARQRELPR